MSNVHQLPKRHINPRYDDDKDSQIENAQVDALINLLASDKFSAYPLVHGTDIDQPVNAHINDLTDIPTRNVGDLTNFDPNKLQAGLLTDRPTADSLQGIYVALDNGVTYYDDGGNWEPITKRENIKYLIETATESAENLQKEETSTLTGASDTWVKVKEFSIPNRDKYKSAHFYLEFQNVNAAQGLGKAEFQNVDDNVTLLHGDDADDSWHTVSGDSPDISGANIGVYVGATTVSDVNVRNMRIYWKDGLYLIGDV